MSIAVPGGTRHPWVRLSRLGTRPGLKWSRKFSMSIAKGVPSWLCFHSRVSVSRHFWCSSSGGSDGCVTPSGRSPRRMCSPASRNWLVLRYVRAVVLVGLVTSLSVAFVVTLLRMESPPHAKAASVRAAMARVQDAKSSLDALHPYWFATAGLLVTIGLGVYTYRRRHIQCSACAPVGGPGRVRPPGRGHEQRPFVVGPSPKRRHGPRLVRARSTSEAPPEHTRLHEAGGSSSRWSSCGRSSCRSTSTAAWMSGSTRTPSRTPSRKPGGSGSLA